MIVRLSPRVKCLLSSVLDDWLKKTKPKIKKNKIIRNDYVYLKKFYERLQNRGRRCSKCHQLIK